MKKAREINYIKPNMGALPPKVGRRILDIMANMPKSDQTEINRKVREVRAYFQARQGDNDI